MVPHVESETLARFAGVETEFFIDNLLDRIHSFIAMIRPASRHGILNSLYQVALHLPTKRSTDTRG